MKKLVLLVLFAISLFANQDLAEMKSDIKLILNKVNELDRKVNELDKKVEVNSVKIEMLQKHMDKRFEDMIDYLWMISTTFLGLVAVTIGFAIWDRKSMIKAAKEEIINDIEQHKLKDFVYKLRELATYDKELAKVLREFHML